MNFDKKFKANLHGSNLVHTSMDIYQILRLLSIMVPDKTGQQVTYE